MGSITENLPLPQQAQPGHTYLLKPVNAVVKGSGREYLCHLFGTVTLHCLWLLVSFQAFNWSPPADGMDPARETLKFCNPGG